jgi:hypothetical protein
MVTRPGAGFDGAAASLLSRSGTYPWIVSKHSLTPKWSYFWIGGDSTAKRGNGPTQPKMLLPSDLSISQSLKSAEG